MSRRPEAPSLGVLAVSGIGVLVVLAFVGALVFGRVEEEPTTDRLAAVTSPAPAGITVIVGRCRQQRVTNVEVLSAGGDTLWRITSEKGSIERRYDVGADAPVEFTTVVPLAGAVDDRFVARATIRRPGHATEIHRATFDSGGLGDDEPDLGDSAPPCPDTEELGGVVILFVIGAGIVVGAYAAMVTRVYRTRR